MISNQSFDEVERLRLACGVDLSETVPKAQEILRRLDVKCRPGSLRKGEACRTVIAFDLACRALDRPIPHKTALRLAGAPAPVYDSALGLAQRFLGEQRRYTCQEIAKAVGGARVGIMAATELKRYKDRFLATYPAKQTASIDLDGTVYAVASFYLCAKKIKHPVDKGRLLELSLVRDAEFAMVCRSMLDLCYSTLGVSISDKPSAERLQQLEKAFALKKTTEGKDKQKHQQQPSPAEQAGDSLYLAPPSSSSAGGAGASRSLTSSALVGRKGGGASGGKPARRSIPLTRPVVGEDPKNHAAALARSIRAASARKWNGGTAVKQAEPGGANDASNAIHDQKHAPPEKRLRPSPSPKPLHAPAVLAPHNSVTPSTATSHQSFPAGAAGPSVSSLPPPRAPVAAATTPSRCFPSVPNPYATAVARKPIVLPSPLGSSASGSSNGGSGVGGDGEERGCKVGGGGRESRPEGVSRIRNSSDRRDSPFDDNGGSWKHDATPLLHDQGPCFAGRWSDGIGGVAPCAEAWEKDENVGTCEARAQWRERALAAMENRIKGGAGSDGSRRLDGNLESVSGVTAGSSHHVLGSSGGASSAATPVVGSDK